ncbi:uncharacterized [Tachysurus ichikawai]
MRHAPPIDFCLFWFIHIMALRKAAVFMALPADKGVSAWSFSTVSIFNIMLLPLNELSVTYCEHQDEIGVRLDAASSVLPLCSK